MACCGGSDGAAPIMAAKGLDYWFNNSHGGLTMAENLEKSAEKETGDVRVEFVGPQTGSARYIGKVSGRTYYAGNNENDRFLNVDPADLEHFEALRYANRPIFERQDKPKKSAAKLDESKAPEGFEWSHEKNAYVPVGVDWINGAWVSRPEVAPNGVDEYDADGNLIVRADGSTGAENLRSNPAVAPGPEGKDALAVDRAAARNQAIADALPKAKDGGDLPKAKGDK
jgi:hypothetical protein